MNDAEMNRLVDAIAAQVRQRLSGAPAPQATSSTCSSPCSASGANCTGCGHDVVRRPADVRKIISLGAARIAASRGVGQRDGGVPAGLAQYIDHTLLKAEATRDDLRKLAQEAREHKFRTCCVNSVNVAYMARELRGSGVGVCAVVGFPLGAMSSQSKAFETREAVRQGACEIDMVINVGALKSGDYATVLDDIVQVVKAAGPSPVKVIIEAASLNDEEKVVACALSKIAGAAFVKTSTGFGSGGATAADVALMKRVVGEELEVKASGGVRTLDDVKAMIEAGATRIGASASVAIVTGKAKGKSKPAGRRSLY